MVIVPKLEQHVLLAKFMLDLCRIVHEHSPDVETAILAMTVGIAEAEGKPLDISAAAAMTGLSRTTVTRKLRAREKAGRLVRIRVGRRILLAPSDSQKLSKDRADFFNKIEDAVKRCREALYELDRGLSTN
jgi:hypothetical protein